MSWRALSQKIEDSRPDLFLPSPVAKGYERTGRLAHVRHATPSSYPAVRLQPSFRRCQADSFSCSESRLLVELRSAYAQQGSVLGVLCCDSTAMRFRVADSRVLTGAPPTPELHTLLTSDGATLSPRRRPLPRCRRARCRFASQMLPGLASSEGRGAEAPLPAPPDPRPPLNLCPPCTQSSSRIPPDEYGERLPSSPHLSVGDFSSRAGYSIGSHPVRLP